MLIIILTNNLADKADEGSIKLMSSLIKRIKRDQPQTEIITYNTPHPLSDHHLEVNKLMFSRKLMKRIRSKREPVLFFMTPTRILNAAIKACVVSFYARGQLSVALTMRASQIGVLPRLLMKWSKAKLIVTSREMYEDYSCAFSNEVHYLKAGIESQKYVPAESGKKAELREKYGIGKEVPVVLHVGHMKEGRNIGKLLELDEQYHIILVTSTYEQDKRNLDLREKLTQRKNITLIEDYVPNIEEIYQLADVYFFPVIDENHCISAPLSVFEAASCNLPIVCTEFGELRQFKGKEGFFFIDSFEPEILNILVCQALQSGGNTRVHIEQYDWDNAVKKVLEIANEPKGRK